MQPTQLKIPYGVSVFFFAYILFFISITSSLESYKPSAVHTVNSIKQCIEFILSGLINYIVCTLSQTTNIIEFKTKQNKGPSKENKPSYIVDQIHTVPSVDQRRPLLID